MPLGWREEPEGRAHAWTWTWAWAWVARASLTRALGSRCRLGAADRTPARVSGQDLAPASAAEPEPVWDRLHSQWCVRLFVLRLRCLNYIHSRLLPGGAKEEWGLVSLSICWGLLPATRRVEPRDSLKGSETSSKFNSPRPVVTCSKNGRQAASPRGPGTVSLPEGVTLGPALPARPRGTGGCGVTSGGSGRRAGTHGALGPGQTVGRDRCLQPACEDRACICSTRGSR